MLLTDINNIQYQDNIDQIFQYLQNKDYNKINLSEILFIRIFYRRKFAQYRRNNQDQFDEWYKNKICESIGWFKLLFILLVTSDNDKYLNLYESQLNGCNVNISHNIIYFYSDLNIYDDRNEMINRDGFTVLLIDEIWDYPLIGFKQPLSESLIDLNNFLKNIQPKYIKSCIQ